MRDEPGAEGVLTWLWDSGAGETNFPLFFLVELFKSDFTFASRWLFGFFVSYGYGSFPAFLRYWLSSEIHHFLELWDITYTRYFHPAELAKLRETRIHHLSQELGVGLSVSASTNEIGFIRFDHKLSPSFRLSSENQTMALGISLRRKCDI